MATCSNCKANLSCGCQKRKAKDGASTCSKCLASYEAGLTQRNIVTVKPKVTTTWGANRYKKI
tara:strand:- start:1075 stop:1263 length:189 start_codon:yes stop_codon:yes gene_type:complete